MKLQVRFSGSTFRKRGHRRGVTLIEAVLFISVALGLIVGGLIFFQQASLGARVQETVRLLRAIDTAVYQTETTGFVGAINQVEMADYLNAGGFIPDRFRYDGADPACAARSPWDECVRIGMTLASQTVTIFGVEGTNMIDVTLDNPPPEICFRLALADNEGSALAGKGLIQLGYMNAQGVSLSVPSPTLAEALGPICQSRPVQISFIFLI